MPHSGLDLPVARLRASGSADRDEVWERFTVVDVDESARSWRWRVTPRLGRVGDGPEIGLPQLELRHAVRGRTGGSATTLEIRPLTWSAVPLAGGYAPLAWWALRRLVAG